MWNILLALLFLCSVSLGGRLEINDTQGNTWTAEEKESLAIIKITEPAKRIGRYTDIPSIYDCYQKCCNQIESDNCNAASMILLKEQLICYTMSCFPRENCEWQEYEHGSSIIIIDPSEETTAAPTTVSPPEITTVIETEESLFDATWQNDEQNGNNTVAALDQSNGNKTGDFDEFLDGDEWETHDVTEEHNQQPEEENKQPEIGGHQTEEVKDPEIIDIMKDIAEQEQQYKEHIQEIIKQEAAQGVTDGRIGDIIGNVEEEGSRPQDQYVDPWVEVNIGDSYASDKPETSVDNGSDRMKLFISNLRSSLASGRLIALIVIVSVIGTVSVVVLVSFKCTKKKADVLDYRRLDEDYDKDAIKPLTCDLET